MNLPLYEFKKVDGKWQSFLSPKPAVYLYQTCGLPKEEYFENVYKKFNTPRKRLEQLYMDWMEFCLDNDLDIEELKGEYNVNEQSIKENLELIYGQETKQN
jgi:hypothetical protein